MGHSPRFPTWSRWIESISTTLCLVGHYKYEYISTKGNDTPYLGEECEYLGSYARESFVVSPNSVVPYDT
jgi:hypothetical protein